MKYTISEEYFDDIIATMEIGSEKEALAEIEKWKKQHEDNLVFISFHRPSDGQKGYLNPDGNHEITGEAHQCLVINEK